MKVKNFALLYYCGTEYRNLAIFIVFFSKVWQLQTPKTTIFLHFIFWLIHQKKKHWRQHALILLRPWFATHNTQMDILESTWKGMNPKLEVVELWLNSSVDHGCNMSIKIIIKFIKGWIVEWIQQSLWIVEWIQQSLFQSLLF
jgi:hypothetical protein